MRKLKINNLQRKTEVDENGEQSYKPREVYPKYGMENFHLKFCKLEEVNRNR